MLAAHPDQENLARQGTRHLQPKTPGARYPKTPLKVPLNDENAAHHGKAGLVARSRPAGNENTVMRGKAQALATPGTRPRTVLGNKTTNAKTNNGQAAGVKEIVKGIERTQAKQATVQKPKPMLVAGPPKVEVRADQKGPLEEEDFEYCPPREPQSRYESDVFPAGGLTFEGLKRENLLRGYYTTYFNPIDEDGVSLKEREFEETMRKAAEETDERIRRDVENCDWSVCDVPETFAPAQRKKSPPPAGLVTKPAASGMSKQPPTLSSRTAAKSLAIPADSKARPLKPLSTNAQAKPSNFLLRRAAKEPLAPKAPATGPVSAAASRSTIGYTKGRSASSIVRSRPTIAIQARGSTDGQSATRDLDATITPASFGHSQAKQDEINQRLKFLSIFDIDEDEADDGLLGGIGSPLEDIEEDDFELKLDL